jgi:hypothetical protein
MYELLLLESTNTGARHLLASVFGEQIPVGTVFVASAKPHPQRELPLVDVHGSSEGQAITYAPSRL